MVSKFKFMLNPTIVDLGLWICCIKVSWLFLNIKIKILDKIFVQIFNPTPPWKGGIKNECIEKLVWELKLQKMNSRYTKIRINHKDEPSTSKIEWDTGFFVSQVEAKSQFF